MLKLHSMEDRKCLEIRLDTEVEASLCGTVYFPKDTNLQSQKAIIPASSKRSICLLHVQSHPIRSINRSVNLVPCHES